MRGNCFGGKWGDYEGPVADSVWRECKCQAFFVEKVELADLEAQQSRPTRARGSPREWRGRAGAIWPACAADGAAGQKTAGIPPSGLAFFTPISAPPATRKKGSQPDKVGRQGGYRFQADRPCLGRAGFPPKNTEIRGKSPPTRHPPTPLRSSRSVCLPGIQGPDRKCGKPQRDVQKRNFLACLSAAPSATAPPGRPARLPTPAGTPESGRYARPPRGPPGARTGGRWPGRTAAATGQVAFRHTP